MKFRNPRNAVLLLSAAVLVVTACGVLEPVAAASPHATDNTTAETRNSATKAGVTRRTARQSLVVPFFSFVPRS